LGTNRAQQALDLEPLKDKDVKTKFCLELKEERTDLEVEECWKNIKDVVKKTARKVIGHKRGSIKENWISKST